MCIEPNSLSDEQKKSSLYNETRLTSETQHIGGLFTPRSVQLVERIINLDA